MAFGEDNLVAADGENPIGEDVGEEVEVFAKFLDECIVARGSVPEQRARILKLVDHYYGYAREIADVMRDRLRLARLARGDSGDSSSSGGGGGPRPGTQQLAGAGAGGDGRAVVPRHDGLADDTAASARRWEEEAQTWDLLRRLLPLRYRDKTTASGSAASTGFQQPIRQRPAADRPPQSRREYWADFIASEPKAHERKTILEWLQSSANSCRPDIEDVVRELQRNADRGEIVAHGWLHTRGAIKQHKRLTATAGPLDPHSAGVADSNLDAPQRLVTQLDPDVTTRQAGRSLAPQDAFFEQAIWLGCYELLRRGKSMSEIRDWCVERTEVWRAAAVSALPLANGEDEDVPDFDCMATVLWRRMCYRLSQEASASQHERAVFGLLAGDLASVEAVSQSWDDLAFAKYNAELRAQFDAYLLRQSDAAEAHALRLLHSDVPTVGHSDTAAPSAVAATAAPFLRDRDGRSRKAANTPAKALQAAVIDEKLDSYLFQQGVLLAESANANTVSNLIPKYDTSVKLNSGIGGSNIGNSNPAGAADAKTKFIEPTDYHGLRILAHVLIIVSALDRLDGKGKDAAALGPLARRHQTEDHAIAAYASFLRLAHLEELIPLYASKLLGERCYTNMAYNLIHIDARDSQVRLLQLMRRLGLDVVRFVKTLPQLFLAGVSEQVGVCPARDSFRILQNSAPTLKLGRMIRPDIFGPQTAEVADDDSQDVLLVDRDDELLIRSVEWMMLVDGQVLDTCDYAVRIYKFFLTARVFVSRASCAEIIRQKTRFGQDLQEENDPSWWDDVFGPTAAAAQIDAVDADAMDEDTFGGSGLDEAPRNQVSVHARPLYELECLVNALDCLETTAVISTSVASNHNSIAKSIDDNAKYLRGYMKPLLKDWLLHSIDDDPDYRLLRETYLPQVVIGYASTLQFAGTTSSRDYLLECMELAAVVAAPSSDVAQVLVATGRMKELVESFASCSKALAIWTSDMKKGPGASSKKMREMGWSRELWSVKQ